MKKSLLVLLLCTSFQFFFSPANHLDPKKILEETTEATEEGLEKITQEFEEQAEDIIEEVAEQKESFFSKVKMLVSFSNFDFTKMPLIYIFLIAFIVGIVTSFTPCIYPMIPITIGILQSQASQSVGRNFLLSTSYVAGMATVYATLGYFAATTSLIFGQWLANPWLIGFLILFFLYLAGSMFGYYEIWMPQFTKKQTKIKAKGSVLYTFLFGAVSGTAASPCLTPALLGLLGFVTKLGNPIVGFFTLFIFAFGLGTLLIVVGTFSTSLTTLPRAGAWMNEIKKLFGFLMIGVAIYFLKPFISQQFSMMLYLALTLATIGYYGFVITRKIVSKK